MASPRPSRRGHGYATTRNRLIPETVIERAADFWANVENALSGGTQICWPWLRTIYENGYGEFLGFGTHRIAYFLHYEVQPGRSLVLHECDNKPCCNPYHLFLGDHGTNARDFHKKRRAKA